MPMGIAKMLESIDVSGNAVYVYAPVTVRKIDGIDVTDRHPQGRYGVLGFVYHASVNNRADVLYIGLDGKDQGRYFHCSQNDFRQRFIEEQVAEEVPFVYNPHVPLTAEQMESIREERRAEEDMVEKVADHTSSGKGW